MKHFAFTFKTSAVLLSIFGLTTQTNAQIDTNAFKTANVLITDNTSSTASPIYHVLTDLDGDGKKDLASANSNTDNIVVFPANNVRWGIIDSQTYGAGVKHNTLSKPVGIVATDLNSDGKTDIIITYYNTSKFSVFVNNSTLGNIAFNARMDFTAPASNSVVMKVGDFDGDGLTDLYSIYFTAATSYIYRNTSSGGAVSFASPVLIPIVATAGEAIVSDFNADAKPDIAVNIYNNAYNSVQVIRNNSTVGNISFSTDTTIVLQSMPNRIAIADLNLDGKIDLVCTNYFGNSISVLENKSDNGNKIRFKTPIHIPALDKAIGTDTKDLNGDGYADIVVCSYTTKKYSIFMNKGLGGAIQASSFYSRVDFTLGLQNPDNILIDDIDGDHKNDLLITLENNNKIALVQNMIFATKPTTASSNITFTNVASTSMSLHWTKGNGTKTTIIAKALSTPTDTLHKGHIYSSNTSFGSGDSLGTGEYIIYQGTGDSVAITNLSPNTLYHFDLVESNGDFGFTHYNNSNILEASQSTTAMPTTGLSSVTASQPVNIYPNPATDMIRINTANNSVSAIRITDMMGKEVSSFQYESGTEISTAAYKPGMYFITVEEDGKTYYSRMVKK